MKKLLLLLSIAFSLTANAQYTKLLDFNVTNGSVPRSYLFYDGTFLYGTSQNGGTDFLGTIFKIKPDGSGYQNLHNFQGNYGDGQQPGTSLIFDGTYLYGTAGGGPNNKGIIFKIKPDGTGYLVAHGFANSLVPIGTPVYDGTNFYGVTGNGIMKTNFNQPNDTLTYSFTGLEGTDPFGSIIYDGTFIYGTTNQGGINGKGVVFKVKPDGSAYDTLMNFSNTIGANPVATPYYDGTYIYGTTINGGANNMGTIYRVKPDGTGDTALYHFSSANMKGEVILVRGHLYGMTQQGGINDDGIIYRIRPDGTRFTKLLDFNGITNGNGPQSALISDGTYLYGTTPQGGANNAGTVFKLKIPVVTNNQNLTVCQGQSVMVSSHTYSVAGTYADTLYSILQDCDSIINTNLTVLSSSSSTSQSYTLCSGQSVNIGTDVYTTTGTYTYTYSGSGCDSVITTNLTVNPSPTLSLSGNTQICANNNNGTILTASGGGTYNWSTSATSNSITVTPTVTTTYSVVSTLGTCTDTAITTVTIHSVTAAYNYSPVTCTCPHIGFWDSSYVSLGDSIVSWSWVFPGGTPATFNGQNPGSITFTYGNHYVCLTVTTANGCIDSTCKNVFENIQAIDEFQNPSLLKIYPNPAQNNFTIQPPTNDKQTLTLFDIRGKQIFTQTISGTTNIDISKLADGVYNVNITSSTEVINKKLIIVK